MVRKSSAGHSLIKCPRSRSVVRCRYARSRRMASTQTHGTPAEFSPIGENDLTVEYCAKDESSVLKSWCVFRRGLIIFVDTRLDHALDAARRRAAAEGCTAWLITPDSQPTKIGPAARQ